MDRDIYKWNILEELKGCKNLTIKEGSVRDLLIENNQCVGVELENGEMIKSSCTVVTTGTFLGGICHIGK